MNPDTDADARSRDDEPPARVIAARTRRWVRDFVVDLGLCPFAAAPLAAGRVRVAVSEARDPDALVVDVARELTRLVAHDPGECETTLLVHPRCLHDFEDHNDFTAFTADVVEQLGLTGQIQVVGFHPDYRFAGAPEGDPADYTNRAPYPTLHLLREASVAAATEGPEHAAAITDRNIERLRALGAPALDRRLAAFRRTRPGQADDV